ncbi:MAG: lactate utilization protein [bacterium]
MHTAKKWFIECQARMVVKSLKRKGYEAVYVPTAEQACKKVIGALEPGQIIGTGGSITLNETGILSRIRSLDYTLLDPDSVGVFSEEAWKLRKEVLRKSDVFITSINALTLDGKIVCVDGAGNRIASMLYGGPDKVIVVCGTNKIVSNVEQALWRAHYVAAVCNARRLDVKVPCAETSECIDCNIEERICRAVLILEYPPMKKEYLVILIGGNYGF